MQGIKWLSETSQEDIENVGRNFFELSLLYKARLPVANGFCITKNSWKEFLTRSGMKSKIDNLLSQANHESQEALNMIANEIKNMILNTDINTELKKEISEAYNNMNVTTELHGLVNSGALSMIKAGRESSNAMISNSYSEKIIVDTGHIYNIKGIENVVNGVKKSWAESITGSILGLVIKKEIKEEESWPSIIVQKMINASRTGIAHLNGDKIVIKALWGLPGFSELDQVKPDVYIVNGNQEYNINDIEINNQVYAFVKDDNYGHTVKREIPLSRRSVQILSEAEVKRLAKVTMDITNMIGEEKQIEWGVDEGRLFITAVKSLRKHEVYNEEVFDDTNEIGKLDSITEVSLGVEDLDDDVGISKADGIGIMESILLQDKDEYFYYIRDDMEDAAIKGIADKLIRVAGSFNNNTVWYKIIDKAEKFFDWRYELEKEGKEDELVSIEINAVKKARELGFKNIGILLPLVTDVEKVKSINALVRKAGLDPGNDVMLGVLIDNPASVEMIDEILNENVDYVSIDMNRLARHTLALKKGEEANVMHPAIMKKIARVMQAARKKDVKTGICNFDASFDLVNELVKLGVDNITANKDDIELVRKSVVKVEKRLLLSIARDSFKKTLN